MRKIYHGKLNAIWQLSFFLYIIDITAKVVWFFSFFFALQLERSAPIESAVQADLHSAMWAEFNSFSETGAVSVDMIATQWEEVFKSSWKNPDRTTILMTGECSII